MKKILVIVLSFFVLALCNTAQGEYYEPTFDLRLYGHAPVIRDQGDFQTCWAFATMSSIESNYLWRTDPDESGILTAPGTGYEKFLGDDSVLSKLHLAWFSFKNPENKKNFAYIRNSKIIQPTNIEVLNHAGNPQMALAFLSRHDGPVKESELPYSGSYPEAGKSPRDYKNVLRIVGARYAEQVNLFNEELEREEITGQDEAVKSYLIINGAVSAGVYWDTDYMSSNFAYYNPSSKKGGHAVTIIGWDDSYSRDNFLIKPENDGAWLVQNSWGTSWGIGGYFWMSYEQVLRYAMSFEVEAANPRIREYYRDDLGFTHEVPLSENTVNANVSVANVFKVKGDHEKLREIGFYSTNNSFNALTYVYDIGTENSIEKFTNAIKSGNQRGMNFFEGIADKGYIVDNLEEPVELLKDHYFAIVTTLTPNKIASADFQPTIAAEVKIPDYRTANAEINARETYFSAEDGIWKDAKYHKFLAGSNEITGFNACIKGFSYVPDERFADDWTLISKDGKAQLSISILRETAPKKISVEGTEIENIFYKIESENAGTGDAKGKFYTLKLICDLKSDDAKITSLKIDDKEVITGNIRNFKFKLTTHNLDGSLNYNYDDEGVSQYPYIDISKSGVSFKDMTQSSGVVESTDGYKKNGESTSVEEDKKDEDKKDEQKDDDDNSNTQKSSGGGGGGCNSGILIYGIVLVTCLFLKKK